MTTRRNDPVNLHAIHYTNDDDTQPHTAVIDRNHPTLTTCNTPHHPPAKTSMANQRNHNHLKAFIDCACDVPCPKCHAPIGAPCHTPSHYTTDPHGPRVATSPRCQGITNQTRTYCDVGDHQWTPNQDTTHATCNRCGRTEPIQP